MVLQWPRLFPANLGNWNDSVVVTSTLCLTFGLLLAQFVWNCNVLLWSFLYWGKGKVQSYKITYFIANSHNSAARWVKVSVLDLFWPWEKGFYCTCFFLFNEIFQWQFDYLPLWRSNLKTDWPFLFSLQPACPAFSINHISSIHSAPLVPRKHLWYGQNLTTNPYSLCITGRKGVCVSFCVASVVSLNGDLQWISLTGRWASRWSPVCIFNKAKMIQAWLLCLVFVVSLCVF